MLSARCRLPPHPTAVTFARSRLRPTGSLPFENGAPSDRDRSVAVLRQSAERGPNVLAIPGTGDPQHLKENVAAAALRLSGEDHAAGVMAPGGDGAPCHRHRVPPTAVPRAP